MSHSSELTRLAVDAETRLGGGGVLALHGRNDYKYAELLEIGCEKGAFHLAWPSSAPAWPFCPPPPPPSESEQSSSGAEEASNSTDVLVASAQTLSAEHAQILLMRAGALLRERLSTGELYAGAILLESGDQEKKVHIVSVHNPDDQSGDGVCFDPEFANTDWDIARFAAVHPPLSAWRAQASAAEKTYDGTAHTMRVSSRRPRPSSPSTSSPSPTSTTGIESKFKARQNIPEGEGELGKESDYSPKARLLFGSGGLDGLAVRMRDISDLKTADEILRIFTVTGWNEARVQPLNIECEAGEEMGALKMLVGANIYASKLSLGVLREAINSFYETNAHVVAGFGGGSVMDGAKSIAALAVQPPDTVDAVFDTISRAAGKGEREITVKLPHRPLPTVLVNGTIGTGASLSDQVLITVRRRDEEQGMREIRHSIFVTFEYHPSVRRTARERTAIVDSRIVSPRRLNSIAASQGGLLVIASCLDVLFTSRCTPQTLYMAKEALLHSSDYLIQARREPTHSDGAARTYLLRGACGAALARESLGAIPLGLALTTALVDVLVDGPDGDSFRAIYARVVVAIVRRCCTHPGLSQLLIEASSITTGDEYAAGPGLIDWLLEKIDDCAVPQVRMLGLTKKKGIKAVRELAEITGIRAFPHPEFENADVLEGIVLDVLDNQPTLL